MYLGIDFGTSGARACVLNEAGSIVHEDRVVYRDALKQTPEDWHDALYTLLRNLPESVSSQLQRIALDATSSSVLLCDKQLHPVSPALLYNDARANIQAEKLKDIAPAGHTVCNASSGLSKFLWLIQHINLDNAVFFMHQADWLSALLTGIGGISDYHNALKSGYDVEQLSWPEWIMSLPNAHLLPQVLPPGSKIASINHGLAQHFKINPTCTIYTGTTDSIAAFIAADVHQPGDAVTSLGTTIVLKLLSTKRVESAEYGIYSHRYGDLWLAGGASNAGGGVLKQYFTDTQLIDLSQSLDTSHSSPLDYYPLPKPGERFPHNDPAFPPRLNPRPSDDVQFLHGMLQGLSRIEAEGYAKLVALGATPLKTVRTSGGGANNHAWQQIRARILRVPVSQGQHTEAAFGSARLAWQAGIN